MAHGSFVLAITVTKDSKPEYLFQILRSSKQPDKVAVRVAPTSLALATPSSLEVKTAWNSSMNMMLREDRLASANSSRTLLSPDPISPRTAFDQTDVHDAASALQRQLPRQHGLSSAYTQ